MQRSRCGIGLKGGAEIGTTALTSVNNHHIHSSTKVPNKKRPGLGGREYYLQPSGS
jgi:hypothetical protein